MGEAKGPSERSATFPFMVSKLFKPRMLVPVFLAVLASWSLGVAHAQDTSPGPAAANPLDNPPIKTDPAATPPKAPPTKQGLGPAPPVTRSPANLSRKQGLPESVGDMIVNRLARWSRFDPDTVRAMLATLFIVLILLLIRMLARRIITRRVSNVKEAYRWRRAMNYAIGILGFLLIGRVWFAFLSDIGTFLGLVSAGLAIAFQDPLVNLAGWLFIMARRPYQVGDRIEVDGRLGDVIDIRLFQTYMLECGNWVDSDQTTGRIILMPNGKVFKTPIVNSTYGFQHIWDEVRVLITFESDWKKAKEILEHIADTEAQPLSAGAQDGIRRAASKHLIFFNKLTPIVYTDVKDSGVQFSLRYLTLPRQRRGAYQRIWEAILEAFGQEPSIDFAYPSLRVYQNQLEGKPEARMPLNERGLPDDRPA